MKCPRVNCEGKLWPQQVQVLLECQTCDLDVTLTSDSETGEESAVEATKRAEAPQE
jgi:uncharacterized protein (DUF983 family)